MKRALFCLVGFLWLIAGVATAKAEILYGITGAGNSSSILYRIDPATGSAELVGPTGFSHVTALSFDPVTGVLYGHQSDIPGSGAANLITIDSTTGLGALVGSTGQQISDMTFSATGVLYGWSQGPQGQALDDLYTIDTSTGLATGVGDSGVGTLQTGLAFDRNGTLWMKTSNDLYTVDPITGKAVFDQTLTFSSSLNNVLAFDEQNVPYSISRRNGSSYLERIDLDSGTVTEVGSITVGGVGVAGISALAFQPAAMAVPAPASLTLLSIGAVLLAACGRLRRQKAAVTKP